VLSPLQKRKNPKPQYPQPQSPDLQFRLYEALEAGAIPIVLEADYVERSPISYLPGGQFSSSSTSVINLLLPGRQFFSIVNGKLFPSTCCQACFVWANVSTQATFFLRSGQFLSIASPPARLHGMVLFLTQSKRHLSVCLSAIRLSVILATVLVPPVYLSAIHPSGTSPVPPKFPSVCLISVCAFCNVRV
jgi:hypothetical protein